MTFHIHPNHFNFVFPVDSVLRGVTPYIGVDTSHTPIFGYPRPRSPEMLTQRESPRHRKEKSQTSQRPRKIELARTLCCGDAGFDPPRARSPETSQRPRSDIEQSGSQTSCIHCTSWYTRTGAFRFSLGSPGFSECIQELMSSNIRTIHIPRRPTFSAVGLCLFPSTPRG